jgi:hypothetical protein
LTKAEKKSIQADVNVLYKKNLRDNPQAAINPISRFQQKRAIKKQYIATRYSKGARTARTTATTAKSALKKGADTVSKTAAAITVLDKELNMSAMRSATSRDTAMVSKRERPSILDSLKQPPPKATAAPKKSKSEREER